MIQVDADDPRPPYEQIRAGLESEITSGRLPAGQRLPTVRQIAGDLRVAVGTAARAYRELEEAGHVETRRSQGTTVRPGRVVAVDVGAAAASFVREVRRGDVELGEVLAAVEAAWADS
jgi:GntR family transcriptional regulator